MSGAITLLTLHAFIEWNGATVPVPFECEVNENYGSVYWESQIFLHLFIFAIRAWLEPEVYKAAMRFPE
jgi:hypothetical protein